MYPIGIGSGREPYLTLPYLPTPYPIVPGSYPEPVPTQYPICAPLQANR